jgi:hypothetical protein
MKNLLYILLFLPLSGFGQSTTKNPPDTTKNMFVKADTTLVVTQELRISKLESQKKQDEKKREKWIGRLVKLIRDLIRDNQTHP